jgi:hypothetical protein
MAAHAAQALAATLCLNDKYARWTLCSGVSGTPTPTPIFSGASAPAWTASPALPIYGMVRYLPRRGMDRKTGVKPSRNEIDCLERTGKELTT